MKFFLLLLLVSVVKADLSYITDITEYILRYEDKLEIIQDRVAKNNPILFRERTHLLEDALKEGSEEDLDFVLENLFNEEVIPKEDKEIFRFIADFSKLDRIPFLRKASRVFFNRGLGMKVDLRMTQLGDVERDGEFLDELINYGFLDVNEAMHQSSFDQNYDLVFFFISRGADVNFQKVLSPTDHRHVLENTIIFLDWENFMSLIKAGADVYSANSNRNLLFSAIGNGSYQIAWYLMSVGLPCEDIYTIICDYKRFPLIVDAVNHGYKLSTSDKKTLISKLFDQNQFYGLTFLIKVPVEHELEVADHVLDEISNVDMTKLSDQQKSEFEVFQRILTEELDLQKKALTNKYA